MKSSNFKRILEETTIELDTNYNETVKRLRSLNNYTREADSGERYMQFICTKDGRFRIGSIRLNGRRYITDRMRFASAADRSYYLEGKVSPKNRKSEITFYIIHQPYWHLYEYIAAGIVGLFLVVYSIISIMLNMFIQNLPVLFIAAIAELYSFISAASIKQNGDNDIEIMKTEALNRIEAVDRWDD